ncbi:hypothetical protein [Polaromonas sp.]|uniref:hypothetical protein n=1 Tax=Polaromonas sp. TaxID=1869339 RepID=UPI0032663F2B
MVFDALLQRGDARWGVFGIAMRSTALSDSLQAQDGLYAVQAASSAGSQWQVGGAIWQTAVAARESARVMPFSVTVRVSQRVEGAAMACRRPARADHRVLRQPCGQRPPVAGAVSGSRAAAQPVAG